MPPSLATIRRELHQYKPSNAEQAAIKDAIGITINNDPQDTEQEYVDAIVEVLPVDILYDQTILSGPPVLFRVIRNYLQLKGLVYQQHQEQVAIAWDSLK
jgi:hypothetical protein